MLETARSSLESFLKGNFDKIKESSLNVNKLRADWLKEHPEYEQYDLQLDVEWQDSTDEIRACLDGCCPWVPPKAKNFQVVTRDWDDERKLYHKMKEKASMRRSLVASVKEDLAWESGIPTLD